MTISRGFQPPVSDSAAGTRAPLDLPWLAGPCVAVNLAVAGPFVTAPLPRGVYYVWVSDSAWLNAGPGADGGGLDATLATGDVSAAPWVHEGGYWPVGIDDDQRIAVKAMDPAKPVQVRIHKGA